MSDAEIHSYGYNIYRHDRVHSRANSHKMSILTLDANETTHDLGRIHTPKQDPPLSNPSNLPLGTSYTSSSICRAL